MIRLAQHLKVGTREGLDEVEARVGEEAKVALLALAGSGLGAVQSSRGVPVRRGRKRSG